jgi:NhaP-type Na+/H+ or K+/H+ antiporter
MLPFAASRGFSFADPYAIGLVFVGAVLLAAVVALTKERERAFTSAIVYLVFGAVASAALSLLGVEILDPFSDYEVIEHLAEFAVIISLFGAGLRIDRPLGLKAWRSPLLLLVIAMPVTIAGIAAWGTAVMGLSLGAAVILGAALAPTDPVLASDVQVGPPGDDDEPEANFALTAEAGGNDGFAFPFVFLGIYIAAEGGTDWIGEWALADVLYAVSGGVALGVISGHGIARLSMFLRSRSLMHERFDGWLAVAATLAVYGVAEIAGTYGFLAAFAAGLAFRRHEAQHESHARVHGGAETVEHFSELALVLLLGSTVTLAGLAEPGLTGWLLIPLLLLVIRPVATGIALRPAGVRRDERLFIGWFGIRGIGSFYYVAVALHAGVLAAEEAAIVYWTVVACVGVSIIAHGLTSTPATRHLTRRERRRQRARRGR